MASFLRTLLGAREARPARRPRLGVEALGDRIMPAGFGLLPTHGIVPGTGVSWDVQGSALRLADGHQGDSVQFRTQGMASQVQVTDAQGHAGGWTALPLRSGLQVGSVEFDAKNAGVSFANLSTLPSSLGGVAQYVNGGLRLAADRDAALETRADGSQWVYAGGAWYRPGGGVTSVAAAGVTTGVAAVPGTVYRFDHAGGEQSYGLGLQDGGFQDAFVLRITRDRTLTRADVLNLLQYVEARGATVSAAELHDLRAIFAAPSVGLAADVSNLANKVVNPDQANTNSYTTGAMAPGNLQAGSSSVVLQDLVGKWFLGNDLPAANGGTYYTITAPLFGTGGPLVTDVAQGSDGDCYLLAGLADVAQVDPQAIRDMFHDNGDGTYSVRLYRWDGTGTNLVADYVTVNSQLPLSDATPGRVGTPEWMYFTDANRNQTLTARSQDGTAYTASGPLWVGLAEKAYVQMMQEGWLAGGQAVPNAYSTIQGGDGSAAVEQITGLKADYLVYGDDGDGYDASNGAPRDDSAFLRSQVTGGAFVQLGAWSGDTADGISGSHAYTVTGYNAGTGLYTVFNPWGSSYTATMTAAQISHDFAVIETVLLPGTEAGELPTLRAEGACKYDTATGSWTSWYAPAPDAPTEGATAAVPSHTASSPVASNDLAGIVTPSAPQSPRPAEAAATPHADTFADAAFMQPLGSLEEVLGWYRSDRHGLNGLVLS